METINLQLVLDPSYREKAKALGVPFEDYLTGLVFEHLLSNGEMDRLIERIKSGSIAARITAQNRAGLGGVVKFVMNGNAEDAK